MLLTFKDLQQKKFTIEVEPSSTVRLHKHSRFLFLSVDRGLIMCGLDLASQTEDSGVGET